MGRNQLDFFDVSGVRVFLQVVDPDVAQLVATCKVTAIWTDLEAPQRVNHVVECADLVCLGRNQAAIFVAV